MTIYITGPESTGKTMLAQSLSEHYNCPWVPEYARQYLAERNGLYDYDDLQLISQGQWELRKQFESLEPSKLISDTGQCVLYIWSEYKFNKSAEVIKKRLEAQSGSLHLLCKPDITWQLDPLREHPDDRDLLFERYINLLEKYQFDYEVVQGKGQLRLKNAISFIDKYE